MPLTNEQGQMLDECKEDIKDIKKIIREIERTIETDGCYNPYNRNFPALHKLLRKTRLSMEFSLQNP